MTEEEVECRYSYSQNIYMTRDYDCFVRTISNLFFKNKKSIKISLYDAKQMSVIKYVKFLKLTNYRRQRKG